MGSQTKQWLRWILVLPVAINILTLLMYLPYLLPDLLGKKSAAYNFQHAISPLVMSILSILFARIVAPEYKFKASLAIAGLWVLILVVATMIVLTRIKINGSEMSILDGGTALISTLIGIIVALIISWRIENNKTFAKPH